MAARRFCPYCGKPNRKLPGANVHHRRCPDCKQTHWVNPAPAIGIAILRGNHILLSKRAQPPKQGQWDLVGGFIEAQETPDEAARREVLEETGWRITGELEPLCSFEPMSGSADKVFHTFVARGAEHVGDPADPNEADRIEWVPVDEVRELVRTGAIHESLTLVAVLYALTFGAIT